MSSGIFAILFFLYRSIHNLPNFKTCNGLPEKDLLPITSWAFFLLTSRTGTVFIFIPTFLSSSAGPIPDRRSICEFAIVPLDNIASFPSTVKISPALSTSTP